MQTKFLQIPKFFSKETGKTEKAAPESSRIRKIPVSAAVRRSSPREKRRKSYRISKPCGCLPGRQQSCDTARSTPLPEKSSDRRAPGAAAPAAGKIRRSAPAGSPAECRSAAGRRPLPESSPKPLPEAAFPGFLIDKGGDVTVHRHLAPLQGEGFQL